MWQTSEGEGKGKDERIKSEKIGRGRIAVNLTFLPPFLRRATQASGGASNETSCSRQRGELYIRSIFTQNKLPQSPGVRGVLPEN